MLRHHDVEQLIGFQRDVGRWTAYLNVIPCLPASTSAAPLHIFSGMQAARRVTRSVRDPPRAILGPPGAPLTLKETRKNTYLGASDGVKRPPTRKNTYDSEHLQENHVKTRLWGYPGASSGLLGPPGGHPGASPGLLKVSCCLRRPPARENTSPQRYFARFLRIFTSSCVYVSVSRGPRHVKTRPSRM